MRQKVCAHCGVLIGAIKIEVFGHTYWMYSSLCESCFEEQVEKDALRLREESKVSDFTSIPVRSFVQHAIRKVGKFSGNS